MERGVESVNGGGGGGGTEYVLYEGPQGAYWVREGREGGREGGEGGWEDRVGGNANFHCLGRYK